MALFSGEYMGHFNNIATVYIKYRFFSYLETTRLFLYKVFTRLLQGCLQGCYKVVARLFTNESCSNFFSNHAKKNAN